MNKILKRAGVRLIINFSLSLIFLTACNQSEEVVNVNKSDKASGLPGLETIILESTLQEKQQKTLSDLSEIDLCKKNPLAEACKLDPVVAKAGVLTMLISLGEIAQQKDAIGLDAARILAANAIKYASPVPHPKILVVSSNQDEKEYLDAKFIAVELLASFETTLMKEPSSGLEAKHLTGYDLVWLNRSQGPLNKEKTVLSLIHFAGGVVLSGKSISQGKDSQIFDLTGLRQLSESAQNCSDNSSANKLSVKLSANFLPGLPDSIRSLTHSEDIDLTEMAIDTVKSEVLAYASGIMSGCNIKRPVIFWYEK